MVLSYIENFRYFWFNKIGYFKSKTKKKNVNNMKVLPILGEMKVNHCKGYIVKVCTLF